MNDNLTQISNVLVIGSGGAGLRAAIEAKLLGMEVTVLGKRQSTDVHTVLAAGGINAAFGNVDNFRSDSVKFQPEVGKFLVFPAWLKHLVYPFTCEGERRMMSFNAKIVFDK